MSNKIDYEDLVNSTTMFFVNDEIEDSYKRKIDIQTELLVDKLSKINSYDGLLAYIQADKNSLDNILCLLNISTEKFKRIISMLRISKGYNFQTEWSLSKTRSYMLEKKNFMDEVGHLLFDGAYSKNYKSLVPQFYLENFKIDIDVISRLSNKDDLKRLIKGNTETSYNNEIANSYFDRVINFLIKCCESQGYTYKIKSFLPLINREASFSVMHGNEVKMVVDVSYMITTSSTQTNYAKKIRETFELQNKTLLDSKKSFEYAMVIDGAGWVGRQSDLTLIYKSSKHITNLNNLTSLEDIISNLN